MKKSELILIGIVAVLTASIPILMHLQQTETLCLRMYKGIHENSKTLEMQLAESESIERQKFLLTQYVDIGCPKFSDLSMMYRAYTGNDLPSSQENSPEQSLIPVTSRGHCGEKYLLVGNDECILDPELIEPNAIIVYDMVANNGIRLAIAPHEIIMNLTDSNTVTFVNDGSTIVNISDNSKGIWHFDDVESSTQRTLIINDTGFYEFLVQNSRFGESGRIVVLSEHTNSLPVETRAKMAQAIITNKHQRGGIEIIGVGSGGAEPGITIMIHEKFREKYDEPENYYYEKYQKMIPFDVPITIEFGPPIVPQ